VFPHDAAMPEFTAALDVDRAMLDFSTQFPQLGRVEACRIDRMRYRKGQRAVFLYELMTPHGKRWVTSNIHGKRQWPAAGSTEAETPTRGSRLLQLFPDDRKLKHLAEIASGGGTEIRDMIGQRPPSLGSPKIIAFEPVRYRPHLSCTFKLTVADCTSANGERHYYAKIGRDDSDIATAEILTHARDGESFELCKPAAIDKQRHLTVWPEAPGLPLDRCLSTDPHKSVELALVALNEFHKSTQPFEYAQAEAKVRSQAMRHGEVILGLVPEFQELVEQIVSKSPRHFHNHDRCPVHSDLKPEHMLIGANKAVLIDLDGVQLSDPALDFGNLAARLEAASWLYGCAEPVGRELAQTVMQACSSSPKESVAAAYALGKLKLATYAITHVISNWEQIAATELASAVRSLQV
jgi:hypothetical protein